MNEKPADIDAYIAAVDDPAKRTALQALRETIQAAAPDATEVISYGIPTFKQDGLLVSFGAAKKHCALYAMSREVMAEHAAELAAFDTDTGTIRFHPDKPISPALVAKLVHARAAENAAIVAARAAKKTAKKR